MTQRVPRRGKIVDFVQRAADRPTEVQVYAAIVVKVATPGAPDSALDLVVCNPHNGLSFVQGVPPDVQDAPIGWTWPPPETRPTRVSLRESAAPLAEAGRRHSGSDQVALDDAHAAIVRAGATCPPPAPVQEALTPAPVVVVTTNASFVAYLIEQGLVAADTPVLDRPTAEEIAGRHVFGELPLDLAAQAAQVTIVPLHLPESLQGWGLSLEELRQVAQPPRTYQVLEVTPAPATEALTPPPAEAAAGAPDRVPLWEAAAAREPVQEAAFDATQGLITFILIRPGFNATRSRYYTPAAVRAIAEAMRGRKMYLNHPTPSEARERPERDVTQWVSTITETWVDAAGIAWGRATIHDPRFLETVQRLAAAKLLPELGASINAMGLGQKTMIEGVETTQVDGVDADDPLRSTDWVTEPGAGGRAQLLEAAAGTPRLPPPVRESTMNGEDTNTDGQPGASGPDPMAAIDGRLGKLEAALTQLAQTVTQMAQATGLDALLAAEPATEAVKRAVRADLLQHAGPITREVVREAIRAKIAEAAAILGRDPGVRGFGAPPEEPGEPEDLTPRLTEAFQRLGLDDTGAARAARGRVVA